MIIKNYFSLLRGVQFFSGIPYPGPRKSLISGILGFAIIAILGYLYFELGIQAFIIPFGASAVLAFGAPEAQFSQPRHIAGGHLVSALSGLTVYNLTGSSAFWAMGLATGGAIFFMLLTKTTHPPAGATALLPLLSNITSFGWALRPVFFGSLIIVLFAVLSNNLVTYLNLNRRPYPTFWW